MDPTELYERDFLAWTEQQAAALRNLANGSNRLDIPHLAEEIEDLGRRDILQVERLLRQVLLHTLKVVASPGSDAIGHWREEIITFQADASAAFAPSMRQKISVDAIWRQAVRAFVAGA